VLLSIKENIRPAQRVFLGVIDVLDPKIETPEEVCDTILEALEIIPADQFGTTDDCGFSPFADDVSTSRDTAFEKIRSRIQGTALAEKEIT
jgi:5-methyltetrahydropteroyltriglutamate--homocysteine methyltransferase